jgi:DNA-binding CsgD family transcriptional regulator
MGLAVLESTSVDELIDTTISSLHDRFAAPAVGLYLNDSPATCGHLRSRLDGVPAGFAERYEAIGRQFDPVQDLVLQSRLPADDSVSLGSGTWQSSRNYLDVARPVGMHHILTGPLLGMSGVVGSLHLGRFDERHPFDHRDLLAMAMLCAEVSMALIALAQRGPSATLQLTPRELSAAELVARGLGNREVAARLGISENTVKKMLKHINERNGLHSRAELAAAIAQRSHEHGLAGRTLRAADSPTDRTR